MRHGNELTQPSDFVAYALWVLFGVIIIRAAWISDDAFITLRTIDNFVNGYGLTWNVGERVQSYTHPLWMFLISGIYFLSREAYYTVIGLSLAVSLLTLGIVIRSTKQRNLATLAGLGILLISKAFVDYSTSGLENPLSHLLLAMFLFIYLRVEETPSNRQVFLLSLTAGLATLNRMDTILLYLPALAWVLWKKRDRQAIGWMVIGFLPFIAWELFSLVYYGFPFPNTAYAKIVNGISRTNLLEQGYLYFLNSLQWDPITLTAVGLAISWSFWRGKTIERYAALGLGLYLLYVLWIGGDFMSGRFFSVLVLGSVMLILPQISQVQPPESSILLAMLALCLLMASRQPFSTEIEKQSSPMESLMKDNIILRKQDCSTILETFPRQIWKLRTKAEN